MIFSSRYTNTPKHKRNTFGRLAVGGKEWEGRQEVEQERALHRTIRRVGREWRTPVSGLASSLVFPAPGPTYLKVKREIKARGVCLSSIATRLTQAAELARAGLTQTAQPPQPAARGQCRRQVPATGLTLGLYPDRPPLMRPQRPLLKVAPPHPAPGWAESSSKQASCQCSLPRSPCSGATTAQQTNVGPGQLGLGRQPWLSPPLSRPQQDKAQVSQFPPALKGCETLKGSLGVTSVTWLESLTPRGSRLLEKHGGWGGGGAEGQNTRFCIYTTLQQEV